MLKRILLLLILFILAILIYFSATSKKVKDFKSGKNINVLFILDNIEKNNNIKFFIAKYNSLNEYIKVVFINEDITILYKTKKARILKDMILETEADKRIEFIKAETAKIFDNKLSIDYYVCLNNETLENIIKIFSKQNSLKNNLNLFEIAEQHEINRDTRLIAWIKIFNYIYNNFNRFSFIKFIKDLYNKNIIMKTNFELKDLFLLYSYFLNEDKTIKYADIPTITKRKRLELDEQNKTKIIDFFDNNYLSSEKYLKVEVLNTTKKSRLAIKAVDKIRENDFDVVDWGSYSKNYEFTTIFDFVNNYEKINELKRILNCGEIIFRPKEKSLIDISILLGQDCNIYDKLDRDKKQ